MCGSDKDELWGLGCLISNVGSLPTPRVRCGAAQGSGEGRPTSACVCLCVLVRVGGHEAGRARGQGSVPAPVTGQTPPAPAESCEVEGHEAATMLRVHVRSHAGGDSPRPRAGRAGQARLPTERPPVRGLFLAPRGAAARAREGGTGSPAALGRVGAHWPPSRTTCRPWTGLEWGAAGGVAGTPVLAVGWNGPDGRTEGHSGPRVSLARAVGAATPTPTRTPLAPRGGGGGAQGQRLLLLCRQPRRPRRHCRSEAQAPRPPAGASARSPSPAGPRHSCLQTPSSRPPPSPGRRPGWGSAAGAAPPPAGGRGLAERWEASGRRLLAVPAFAGGSRSLLTSTASAEPTGPWGRGGRQP